VRAATTARVNRARTQKAAGQNRSHAVMSQRQERGDSLDHFPTPPWATRALVEHVLIDIGLQRRRKLSKQTCREPTCGEGYMARTLAEYFAAVEACDIKDYGFGAVRDYLAGALPEAVDWTIGNPPFNRAVEIILRAIASSRQGVAMLVRTVFLESEGRYRDLFTRFPPAFVAPFVERVVMKEGRLENPDWKYWDTDTRQWRTPSTATSYCWLVWAPRLRPDGRTELVWIPPSRRRLARVADWPLPRDRNGREVSRETYLNDSEANDSEDQENA
jgi:hypothetical protein